MKVSSPVGEFPFEPERLRLQCGRVALEGKMGAWPARVEMAPEDGLRFARVAGPALALPALALLAAGWLLGRGRKRRADEQ